MLDQLVESKNNSAENRRKSRFLLVTFAIAITAMLSSWTYSLFAKDFGMGGDDLSLTTLVAPVPVPDEEPPPEPERKPQEERPQVATREELYSRLEDSFKIPDKADNTRQVVAIPKFGDFMKGQGNNDPAVPSRGAPGREVEGQGTGLGTTPPPPPPEEEEAPPPKTTPRPAPKTVSGGVLNGKATSLPKPPYPPAARAVRAAGAVSVQVLISESGSVISANAVSGHPLLRAAAEGAARGARFSPTLLSGQPVKVSGVITYNFVP